MFREKPDTIFTSLSSAVVTYPLVFPLKFQQTISGKDKLLALTKSLRPSIDVILPLCGCSPYEVVNIFSP